MMEFNQPHNAHILELEGVENFRDIGGYTAAEGKRIRWGKVFRSGHLAHLSDFDLDQLAPLNICTRVDLRTGAERLERPSRWYPDREVEVFTINLPGQGEHSALELFESIMAGEIDRDEVRSRLLRDYTALPLQYQTIIRRFLKCLIAEKTNAVIVHCTAGKDRTGVIMALLLELLGVPRDVIFEDYLLSNIGFSAEHKLEQIARDYAEKVDDLQARIHSLRPLICVEPQFLEAAFHAIEQQFGDTIGYFHELLQLEEADITRIRQNLLA